MVRKNVMTEAEMRAKVARKCTSERKGVVRIDMKEWELVRRNASNKTGWNTREVDLWAAREVEAGRMVLNKTSAGREHGVMKPLIRKDTIAGRGTSPKAEKARAMARVRKWVTKNARGKLITAAQMKTLKDNTRGRNRTASEAGERGPTVEVEAALILVAEEEAMQIECPETERKGWAMGAVQWAVQQKWITKKEARVTERKVREGMLKETKDGAVCLELGSGWGGATQGLRASLLWSRVLEVDMVQQNLGQGLGTARPDIKARFVMPGQKKQGGLFRYFRIRGGVKKGKLASAWISSSCKWASTACGLNVKRAVMQKKRGFFGGTRRIPQTEKQTVDGLLKGIRAARKQDPRFQYAWENVGYGALRHYPKMQKDLGEGTLVFGCAYGKKNLKPYRVWMSPEARRIFRPIHPTDKASMCETCKKGLPHVEGMCPKKGSEQKRVREVGQTIQGARNRVPWRMAAHISVALKQAWENVNAGAGNQRNRSGWGI